MYVHSPIRSSATIHRHSSNVTCISWPLIVFDVSFGTTFRHPAGKSWNMGIVFIKMSRISCLRFHFGRACATVSFSLSQFEMATLYNSGSKIGGRILCPAHTQTHSKTHHGFVLSVHRILSKLILRPATRDHTQSDDACVKWPNFTHITYIIVINLFVSTGTEQYHESCFFCRLRIWTNVRP